MGKSMQGVAIIKWVPWLNQKTPYRNQDFLNALDDKKTLINVETLLAVAQSKLVTDQVNLFISLGGGRY